MPRFTHKWLSLLLALVLGLMPFSRAMADILPAPSNPSASHSADLLHAGHVSQAEMNDNSCEGCTTAHSCGSSSCVCYQCGTCTATLPHTLLTIHFASLAAPLPSSDVSQLAHHPFLLFRPPRA
jgi:hypothetical protein